MNKLIVVLVLALGGLAVAQPAATAERAPDPAPAAGAPAQPAAGAPAEPPDASPPPPPPDAGGARKACTDAMNADPEFAKSIIATVDKQIDQKTIDAHTQAAYHIAKNQKHVILAYAAMWIVAALFVVFLWRRQQVLKGEIAQLRKDLEAAGREGTT